MEPNPQKKHIFVKISDFEVKNILGVGSFGKVKLVRRKKDSAILTVKSISKTSSVEKKQTDHILNECSIISQLNHPMIVTDLVSIDWL